MTFACFLCLDTRSICITSLGESPPFLCTRNMLGRKRLVHLGEALCASSHRNSDLHNMACQLLDGVTSHGHHLQTPSDILQQASDGMPQAAIDWRHFPEKGTSNE